MSVAKTVQILTVLLVALSGVTTLAQNRAGAPPGRAGGPPPTPRAAALADLTGQWVSLVT